MPLPANAAAHSARRRRLRGDRRRAASRGTDGAIVDGAPTYRTHRQRADVAAGQRRRAGDRLHPERPLSREAHDRPAARHAARRIARRRGADVRRSVRHADADRRHLRHARQLHAAHRRAGLSRREHDDRECVRLSGERGEAGQRQDEIQESSSRRADDRPRQRPRVVRRT